VNFNLLISILLFVFFIVVPLLSRLQGRRRPQTRSRPARPTIPAQRNQDQTSVLQQGSDMDDSFLKRLEEARRRVQEALDTGEGDRTSSQPEMSPTPRETGGGSEPTTAAQPFLPAQSPKATSALAPAQAVAPSMRRTSLRRTKALESPMAKRSPPNGVISVRSRSIVQGLIWHMILSEPLGKTDTDRRLVSQPRSR
jgi:hypothetical protein